MSQKSNPVRLGQTPIDDLPLSTRSQNALRSMGVMTVRELTAMSERQLMASPNIGRKSVIEIAAVLSECGLSLGLPVPEEPKHAKAEVRQFDLERFLAECRKTAFHWYGEIAHRGCPSAHNILGYMHQQGIGTPRDLPRARRHYSIAARMGYDLAIYNLGLLALADQSVVEAP